MKHWSGVAAFGSVLRDITRDDLAISNATLKEAEWWRQVIEPHTGASGTAVTVNTAMQVAAVTACVRILAETVSSLPLVVYERGVNGARNEATDQRLYQLLKFGPNDIQSPMQMLEQIMTGLTLRGNGYAQLVRDQSNRVKEIRPLLSQDVTIEAAPDGGLQYQYRPDSGAPRTFKRDEIWHVAGFSTDGIEGRSPITLLRDSVAIAQDADRTAANLLGKGLTPGGIFEFPNTIDEKNYELVQERLKAFAGGKNAGKPLILQNGMKFQGVSLTPEDAQLLSSRKFQIAEIARVYRVPLHMLNELDKATFSNIEHQSLEFVMHTIRPWCARIEQAVNRDLIGATGQKKYFAEFRIDALLRGDMKTRFESYGKAITNGWMSRNEVRRKENLNPVEGLDEYLTPLNMSEGSESDE